MYLASKWFSPTHKSINNAKKLKIINILLHPTHLIENNFGTYTILLHHPYVTCTIKMYHFTYLIDQNKIIQKT